MCWGLTRLTGLASTINLIFWDKEGVCPEARLDRERRYGVREGSRKDHGRIDCPT